MTARWEHDVRHFNGNTSDLKAVLAEAGTDGWELVSVDWDRRRMALKRPAGGA